jgi:hypothetical protein
MADVTRTITTIDIMRIGFTGMATGIITEKTRRSRAAQRDALGTD